MFLFFAKKGDGPVPRRGLGDDSDGPQSMRQQFWQRQTVRGAMALLLGIASLVMWMLPACGAAIALAGLFLSIDIPMPQNGLLLLALGCNIIGLLCCIINIIYRIGVAA